MAQQHTADGLRVAAAAHLVKEHVVLFFFFGLLFGKAALAVNEGVDACADDDDYCRHTAEAHGEGHEEASREGHAGGDEPAADDRKHARYAEHRALAAPCSVGERGTHCHHKGDVGSGKGQFQGGAEGDEQGGYDEVHRSAHEVVCRAVGQGHVGRREAAFHEVRHGTRRDALHECAYVCPHAHQAAGNSRRAEHLVALIAARQPHLGLHHIVCLLRPRQREHHNQAGGEEEHGLGVRRSVERVHAETPRIGAARGGEVAKRRQACEGHADEVHKVVAGKGRGEGEGAREHHDAEHVYFQRMEQLHEQREHHEACAEYNKYMFIEKAFHLRRHKREVLQALEEHEVDNGGDSHAAEETDFPAQPLAVVESEEQAGQVLHERAYHERHRHRKENGEDHLQRLVGVHIRAKRQRGAARHFQHTERKGRAEQFKHHRDGCRRGHTKRVEDVEQHHVGHHYGEKHEHHLAEDELLGAHDAVAGDVHHAVAHHRAAEHAHGRHRYNRAKPRHLRADGRVEKVNGVVAHAHPKVERREDKEECYNSEIHPFHK